MITLRKAKERHHDRRSKQETWFTFGAEAQNASEAHAFGALEVFKEDRLPPRVSCPRQPHLDAEIVTYVREGTLAYEDATGRSGLIEASEFQRMTVGRGIRYSETNASPTGWAHVFQIWLRPSDEGLTPGHEQKRFSIAARSGVLCLVASPDARKGSLCIHQDAFLYSSIVAEGQHIIHDLSNERHAWIHVVDGQASLGAAVLGAGDGAGFF
ncbi:MAG: pirin family protein [Deltaproteobacteria bacterium]|nr:pirin family protein [Deltaproteobacteria bacterium]